MNKSKRMTEARAQVEARLYEVDEALALIEKLPKAKFDESIEMHVKLGVDSKQADQQVRGTVVLPNGTGKSKKVLVLAKSDKAAAAEAAGADYVGDTDYLNKIQQGWFEFDVIVATPDMMGELGRLGRILGPKGLMPNPKTGTVTMNVANAVKEIKNGKVEYRCDKVGNIHVGFGKASFDTQKLVENFKTIYDVLAKAKPSTVKGVYFKNIAVTSSMGPSVKVDSENL